MKKIYLILTPLFLTILVNAQEEQPINDDTTKIKMGNMTIIFNDDSDDDEFDFDMEEDSCDDCNDHNSGIGFLGSLDIGMNGLMNSQNSTVFSPEYSDMSIQLNRSRAFGSHIMMTGLDLFKGHVFVSPGLGITWNSYHFEDKNISLSTTNDSVVFIRDSNLTFDKYKLRVAYLELPITLGFRIGNLDKNYFTIQAGVVGGLNIGTMVKQRYILDGAKYKDKIKDDFNVNPFKLDGIAKIKFNNHIGVFARYSLIELFEKNKTQNVYPFAVGITFGGA